MKSIAILHRVKHMLKGKSAAVPQIANIQLTDGTLTAAIIFEGHKWEGDELVPLKREQKSLYELVERIKT